MAFQLAEAYVELSQRGFGGVMGAIGRVKSGLGSLVSFATGPLGVAMAGVGAAASAGGMISLAASMEQTEAQFKTLLGSADLAKQKIADLQNFAATTPFQFEGLAQSAKTLLSFGVANEQIIPTMQTLGDVAAATGNRVGELANIYGKVKANGRLMTESLDQFNERGIPVGTALQEMFGKTGEEIRKMASDGQISFGDLQAAMAKMTGEGGIAFGGMAAQAGTLGGVWSTLKDNVTMLMTGIGQAMVDGFNLKESVANLTGFVQRVQKDWMPSIVGAFAWVGDNIITPFKDFASEVIGIYAGFFSSISAGGQSLVGVFEWVGSNIIAPYARAFKWMLSTTTGFVGYVVNQWGPSIVGAFAWVGDNIVGPIVSAVTAIIAMVQSFANYVVAEWSPKILAAFAWLQDEIVPPLVDAFDRMTAEVLEFANYVNDTITPHIMQAFSWLGENIVKPVVSAITWMTDLVYSFVVDWDLYMQLAGVSLANQFNNMYQRVSTFFSNAATMVGWFADNFVQIVSNLANNAMEIFGNWFQQVKNNWQSLLTFFTTGKLEFDFSPIRKNFDLALKGIKLPEMEVPELDAMRGDMDRIAAQMAQRQQQRDEDARKRAQQRLEIKKSEMTLEGKASKSQAKSTEDSQKKETKATQDKIAIEAKADEEKKRRQVGFVSLAELADKMQSAIGKDSGDGAVVKPVPNVAVARKAVVEPAVPAAQRNAMAAPAAQAAEQAPAAGLNKAATLTQRHIEVAGGMIEKLQQKMSGGRSAAEPQRESVAAKTTSVVAGAMAGATDQAATNRLLSSQLAIAQRQLVAAEALLGHMTRGGVKLATNPGGGITLPRAAVQFGVTGQ